MVRPILTDSVHYSDLVARQVDQYKETELMHDLPPVFDYWSVKHNASKSAAVTGKKNLTSFYADYFQRCLEESESNFLVSIGSGDSSIEIAIVKELIAKNVKNFFFICLELSPVLIEKARKKIDTEQLGDIITAAQIDINSWKPSYSFAGVMAHHSLHHILDLELLFNIIKKNLAPNGRFLTADIIGRNGHMRWPEALVFIRKIWKTLPRKYKFHHQLNKYDDYYDNWDCSAEGFEGIRAQDILPLLVSMFSFEVFYGYGNLTDTFIDRGFGPNFDPANPQDTKFIDYIEITNEQLISDGILKPTTMLAVMGNEHLANTSMHKHWSPAFCIREPLQPPPVYDVDLFIKDNWVGSGERDEALNAGQPAYQLNRELKFTNDKALAGVFAGTRYLTYGWSYPDTDCTWSSCEDAAVIIPLKQAEKTNLLLTLNMLVYHSPLYKHTLVEILLNGKLISSLKYDNVAGQLVSKVSINIPFTIPVNKTALEIKFMMPNRRQPQYEHGPDLRALGIGLISLKIAEN